MTNSKTIAIPKNTALSEQISEVKKQLREWLRSLEPPFRYPRDALRLKRYEKGGRKHVFEYEVYYRSEPPPTDDKSPLEGD